MFPCPLHLPMVHHLTTTQKRPRKRAQQGPYEHDDGGSGASDSGYTGEVGQLNGAMRDVWDVGGGGEKDARTLQAPRTRGRGRLTGEARLFLKPTKKTTVTVYQCFGNKNATKKSYEQ